MNKITSNSVLTVITFNLQFRLCTLGSSQPSPSLMASCNSFRLLLTNSGPRAHLQIRTMMLPMKNNPQTVAMMATTFHRAARVAMTMTHGVWGDDLAAERASAYSWYFNILYLPQQRLAAALRQRPSGFRGRDILLRQDSRPCSGSGGVFGII